MADTITYLELIKETNTDKNYEIFNQLCEQLKFVIKESFIDDINRELQKYKDKRAPFNITMFSKYVSNLANAYIQSFHNGLWYYLKTVGPYDEKYNMYIHNYMSKQDQHRLSKEEKIRRFEQSSCFYNTIYFFKEEIRSIMNHILLDNNVFDRIGTKKY